ncbi:MAG: type III pantothenate kinase [Verrucomicrobiales bacterium]|nr:type III pantothenate kinase [Verrucomicrobiales bacterium]
MKPGFHRAKLLLLDIGNTHCHVGLSTPTRLLRHTDLPTKALASGSGARQLGAFLGGLQPTAVALCSVVPTATRDAARWVRSSLGLDPLVLTHATVRGVGLNYPRPETIGPDRLANAIAARHYHGAPCVVVDFGTAVTFDIVDGGGNYIGGIIAPGLAAMTDYLHEKTALLPRIRIREVKSAIGRSTEEAMLVGAVHGYRGLVRELIGELRKEMGTRRLPVIATGGYAHLLAQGVTDIHEVRPNLTLEGLRLLWLAHQLPTISKPRRSGPAPR